MRAWSRPGGQGWFARVRIVPFVNSIDWADDSRDRAGRSPGPGPECGDRASRQPAASPGRDGGAAAGLPVGTEMIVRRQEWFLEELPWKLQDRLVPEDLVRPGAPTGCSSPRTSPEGLGAYLHGGARPGARSGTKFYFLPRKPTSRRDRASSASRRGRRACVIELVRTACIADDDESRPLVHGRRNLCRRQEPVRELAVTAPRRSVGG